LVDLRDRVIPAGTRELFGAEQSGEIAALVPQHCAGYGFRAFDPGVGDSEAAHRRLCQLSRSASHRRNASAPSRKWRYQLVVRSTASSSVQTGVTPRMLRAFAVSRVSSPAS